MMAASEINWYKFPITALSYKARNLLSNLLNSKKILPSEGPIKLPRDWRGLAYLLNISSEFAAGLECHHDKISKILDVWLQQGSSEATVGLLFEYLQQLDRFDVYDDLQELHQKGLLLNSSNQNDIQNQVFKIEDERDDLITYDDRRFNQPQYYHAYVLYSKEDQEFVDDLLKRMREQNFRLCTEDDLVAGHFTPYGPVSRLISERCHRIILIYSPDFLRSPANAFYMDYAQAVGIELKKPKIIPCMYRQCQLPTNLSYYHKLYYTPPGQKAAYDFWERLSLELVNLPSLPYSPISTNSSVHITEMKQITNGHHSTRTPTGFLALPPSSPKKSISMNSLTTYQVTLPSIPTDDSKSLSNISSISNISESKTKKLSRMRKIYNTLTGKKRKEKQAIMVPN